MESAVVNFKLRDANEYQDINIDNLKKFISLSFSHKRKTLKNNIGADTYCKIEDILIKNNFSSSVRAEEVPLSVYIEICNKLYK